MEQNTGALQGIRVLDLSRMLPGPYCSMMLGDHGAEVIAVENRKLQQDDLFFGDIYRNKYHISLDLKTDQGKEIFKKLAGNCDILLEGFRPGVAERLGVDYATVSQYNKEIIYCSISGFGQSGPNRKVAGHDVNYLAKSGILGLMGSPDKPPSIPGIQIGDIAGGSMQAFSGILLALFHRQRSGKGQFVDISMTDGLLGLLTLPMFQSRLENRWVGPSDGRFSHRFACYSTYTTADNRYVAIGAVEQKFWKKLCEVIDCGHFVELQYKESAQSEIKSTLEKIFKTKSMAEWELIFDTLDSCCSGVATLEEVLEDEHFKQRGMILDSGQSKPGEKSFGIPVKLSLSPGRVRRKPPSFGEDTQYILTRLGYSERQIASFEEDGVL